MIAVVTQVVNGLWRKQKKAQSHLDLSIIRRGELSVLKLLPLLEFDRQIILPGVVVRIELVVCGLREFGESCARHLGCMKMRQSSRA